MQGDCDTPTEGHIMTSDPGAYRVMAKTTSAKLDDMLIDETLLTTRLSPKNSSSKSSVSMEESERTC